MDKYRNTNSVLSLIAYRGECQNEQRPRHVSLNSELNFFYEPRS
jgi:hypothetical protein